YVERNTVTAWLSQAFPFPASTDTEAVRVLGAVLADEFGPGLDRPEVFTSGYEVERHGSGGALILHLVLAPGAASAMAEEVEARVVEIARDGIHAGAWERVAERFRGERLLDLERPEARAAALARSLGDSAGAGLAGQLAPGGWPGRGWLPTPARVQAAAGALGFPARAVVGPRSARAAVSP
ncbi:MAG: hypothetical protein ACOCVZ_09530, partial [Gemmatimonadota bacterium]